MARAHQPAGYRIAKAILRRPLYAAYDITVERPGDLPPGPVILAANHRSFMDSVFLALVVDRPVSFLAKAEYFDRRRTAWMFRATGQIPIRRGSPAGAREALEAARDVLAAGGVVGVYPEGTRSRDGELHRGHLGPARLASASGAPIVPVGLVGTENVQPPGQMRPSLGKKVVVRFGSPRWIEPRSIEHSRDRDVEHSGDRDVEHSGDRGAPALRDFTDLVMGDIAGLCGQPRPERFSLAGV